MQRPLETQLRVVPVRYSPLRARLWDVEHTRARPGEIFNSDIQFVVRMLPKTAARKANTQTSYLSASLAKARAGANNPEGELKIVRPEVKIPFECVLEIAARIRTVAGSEFVRWDLRRERILLFEAARFISVRSPVQH
jgi:hypothetical protein